MSSSTSGGAPAPATSPDQKELTLPDIRSSYKARWVAMVVTARDKNLQPIKGKVVADDVDRYMLRQKLKGYTDICIFFTGEPPYPLLL